MHVAEVLSDLTSLRVCGPTEALALVRASSNPAGAAATGGTDSSPNPNAEIVQKDGRANDSSNSKARLSEKESDLDIRRVYELRELHDLVNGRYAEGHDSALDEARALVRRTLDGLQER
ncbi:MAG: hypothetical protein M1815_006051 [Lichina confinis]|nr:MAG: hypothetical protein M1815_006051 [Lichina confinis]